MENAQAHMTRTERTDEQPAQSLPPHISPYTKACDTLSIFLIDKERGGFSEKGSFEDLDTYLLAPSAFYGDLINEKIAVIPNGIYSMRLLSEFKGFIPREYSPYFPHKVINIDEEELFELKNNKSPLLALLARYTVSEKIRLYFTNGARSRKELEDMMEPIDDYRNEGFYLDQTFKRLI